MANNQNLKPRHKGDPPLLGAGRPVGSFSFTTIIRDLLKDTELADKVISKKPEWWYHLPNKRMAEAIVVCMMVEAMKGNVRAAEWIASRGFGDEFLPEPEEPVKLHFVNEIPSREVIKRKVIDGQIIEDSPNIQT